MSQTKFEHLQAIGHTHKKPRKSRKKRKNHNCRKKLQELWGIKLEDDEDVHHIDFNRNHNCEYNWMVLKRVKHNQLHNFPGCSWHTRRNKYKILTCCQEKEIA